MTDNTPAPADAREALIAVIQQHTFAQDAADYLLVAGWTPPSYRRALEEALDELRRDLQRRGAACRSLRDGREGDHERARLEAKAQGYEHAASLLRDALTAQAQASAGAETPSPREELREAAEYLVRLELWMLKHDLDGSCPESKSPSRVAESICPGFNALDYELSLYPALARSEAGGSSPQAGEGETGESRGLVRLEALDDGTEVWLEGYAGGAHPLGMFGTVQVAIYAPDGAVTRRTLKATSPSPAAVVEAKNAVRPNDLLWLKAQRQVGHCSESNFELRERRLHNKRIDRLLTALQPAKPDREAGE